MPGDLHRANPNPRPSRIKGFATYFKGYMGVGSIVTASLPMPITALNIIPIPTATGKFLSAYTSLFCFLLLGFIFYSRHSLARLMFWQYLRPRRVLVVVVDGDHKPLKEDEEHEPRGSRLIGRLPGACIILCFCTVLAYHGAFLYFQTTPSAMGAVLQFGLYILIFTTAETAFILMATKEYLQDSLGLSDEQVIRGPASKTTKV